jgi:hypothetical protein
VVREGTGTGNQSVGASAQRFGDDKIQGTNLIAAECNREEIVALLSEDSVAHTLGRLAEFAGTSADAALVERVDTLRGELDPGAPLWRLRLAAIVRDHPRLVERLALRREDQRAIEEAVALTPQLVGATDPVEIARLDQSVASFFWPSC